MSSFVDRTAGAVEYCESMIKVLSNNTNNAATAAASSSTAATTPETTTTATTTTTTRHLVEYYYQPIAEFCQQKLWHQLTLRVLEFVQDPTVATTVAAVAAASTTTSSSTASSNPYLAMYDKVILSVDSKLHPLLLGRIAAAVAYTLATDDHDMTAAKAVLENLLLSSKKDGDGSTATATRSSRSSSSSSRNKQLGVGATIYIQSCWGLLQLLQQQQQQPLSNETLVTIHETIRTNASKLQNEWSDQPAIVHAAHYEQALQYYKTVGPPEAFFEQCMSFLHYAPPPDAVVTAAAAAAAGKTTTTKRTTNYHQLAVDLCLAALTGDGVYNLSQVVQEQDKLLSLLVHDANYSWLVELLQATAAGHVAVFQQLTQQHAAAIAQQPALVNRAAAVQEKLTLLALVDLVFSKPSNERHLQFAEIAQHLQIHLDQVEWVVMRALSVKLIEGSMDQVLQTVHVTHVVPRVLNSQQLRDLAARFGTWASKVSVIKDMVQEQTAATFA